jgi:large subunit ribosomal protein L32e
MDDEQSKENKSTERSMSKNSLRLLKVRKIQKVKKPHFKRADAHKFKRIDSNWRRPRGLQGKQRRQVRAKGSIVKPGFGSPKEVKGLHPSGFEDVLVFNLNALYGLNPKVQAIRIGRTVGTKKKIEIEAKAKALGIKILNAIKR